MLLSPFSHNDLPSGNLHNQIVANDSVLTLLGIYSDIMSDVGQLISNCENCGQLMITDRSNASFMCGKTTCKKGVCTRQMTITKTCCCRPHKNGYFIFDNKCWSYRKKLAGYSELLEKYNKTFDKQREKIRAFKSEFASKSSPKDIEQYDQMCSDACVDLQDLAKRLKAAVKMTN